MQPGETNTPQGSPEPSPAPLQTQQFGGFADAPQISWTASEYMAHDKPAGWYAAVGLGSAALAIVVYLLTDLLSGIVILLIGIIFGIVAARPPRTLQYHLDHGGVTIGEKFYPYGDFKSFSVIEEEAIYSILLLPMRRFMPGVSIYYPPDQENEIMTVLSSYLPHEERPVDMVDRLARKLRF